MNQKQAKDFMRNNPGKVLQPDRSGGFICPICGSGSGKNGSGISTKDGIHFTCWAGQCFTNADIIDILGIKHDFPLDGAHFPDRLKAAAAEFGIPLDPGSTSSTPPPAKPAQQPVDSRKQEGQLAAVDEPARDYTLYFYRTSRRIEETDYHRGLSLEVLRRFSVGYDPAWVHPEKPAPYPSPRLIIPTSTSSYIARAINENTQPKIKNVGSAKHLFNPEALKTASKPIFIVEGAIDAMSVIDAGGEAIGLNSTSNLPLLLNQLDKEKPEQPLIFCFDNDEAGRAATERAQDFFTSRQPWVVRTFWTLPDRYNDPNEFFMADKEGFAQTVAAAEAEARELQAIETSRQRAELEQESAAGYMDAFKAWIRQSAQQPFFPTGFTELDTLLDGGLYPGLYVVGAVSSLGKTTFCLQIADTIAAKRGQDVLIFSLEMARTELIAKSISRLTRQIGEARAAGTDAKTTRGILTGSRYDTYSREELDLIESAEATYQTFAKHIFIREGMGDIGTAQIREEVKRHTALMGKPPVVVIDYIQILRPFDPRASDKQIVDRAMSDLKRISRDFSAAVVGISSFNRSSYSSSVSMESFKESGAVEYSSDVLIGLQLDGMDYQAGDEKKDSREGRIKQLVEDATEAGKNGGFIPLQAKVLKNRNGTRGSAPLQFCPRFNLFKDGKKTRAKII